MSEIARAWELIRDGWTPRKHGPFRRVPVLRPVPVRAYADPGEFAEDRDEVLFRLGEIKGWSDGSDVWRWRDVIGEYRGDEAVVAFAWC